MRSLVFTSLAATAAASPSLARRQAECTREFLTEAAALYIEAQTAGDPALFTLLAPAATYTENFVAAEPATGILSSALAIDFTRSLYDTTQCATYSEVIVTDPGHPYVIGTQMFFEAAEGDDGGFQVTTMESIVTDEGDWLFDAAKTFEYASAEDWFEIPEADRDTREAIQAAGDAYCDLFNDKSVQVPWGTPCRRLEGGMYTGSGAASDSCDVGVPSGVSLVNRRYVIDEVLGTVDIFLNFGGPDGIPDSHEFRMEKGVLRWVHTITAMTN